MKQSQMIKNGFTLVELLISMLIAMLCIIMLLMLFKQISSVGGTASRNAEYDAQLETGVLVVQKLVANAGYGSGQATDIVLDSASPQSVYWRIQPNPAVPSTNYECYRIKESIAQDTSNPARDIHTLKKYKNVADCGKDKDMTTITEAQWTPITDSIVRLNANHPTNADGSLKSATTLSDAIFSYTIISNCKPFGIQGIKSSKGLTITAKRLDVTSGTTGSTLERSICLNNIP